MEKLIGLAVAGLITGNLWVETALAAPRHAFFAAVHGEGQASSEGGDAWCKNDVKVNLILDADANSAGKPDKQKMVAAKLRHFAAVDCPVMKSFFVAVIENGATTNHFTFVAPDWTGDTGLELNSSTKKLRVSSLSSVGWCEQGMKLRMDVAADSPLAGNLAIQTEFLNATLGRALVARCPQVITAALGIYEQGKSDPTLLGAAAETGWKWGPPNEVMAGIARHKQAVAEGLDLLAPAPVVPSMPPAATAAPPPVAPVPAAPAPATVATVPVAPNLLPAPAAPAPPPGTSTTGIPAKPLNEPMYVRPGTAPGGLSMPPSGPISETSKVAAAPATPVAAAPIAPVAAAPAAPVAAAAPQVAGCINLPESVIKVIPAGLCFEPGVLMVVALPPSFDNTIGAYPWNRAGIYDPWGWKKVPQFASNQSALQGARGWLVVPTAGRVTFKLEMTQNAEYNYSCVGSVRVEGTKVIEFTGQTIPSNNAVFWFAETKVFDRPGLYKIEIGQYCDYYPPYDQKLKDRPILWSPTFTLSIRQPDDDFLRPATATEIVRRVKAVH